MAKYIERDALFEFPIRADHCDKEHANEHFIFGIESVMEYAENLPAADVVNRKVYEQTRWERDVVIEQLKSIGKGLGERMDDVVPVSRISVKDRLPKNGENVLCWYEYFRYGDFNEMFATYGIGCCYNGHWSGEVTNGTKARVLAWTPLPEPLEENGDDENEID